MQNNLSKFENFKISKSQEAVLFGGKEHSHTVLGGGYCECSSHNNVKVKCSTHANCPTGNIYTMSESCGFA